MDGAFKSRAFAGHTTAELRKRVDLWDGGLRGQFQDAEETIERMRYEIARRDRAKAGDKSVMTAGERLRFEQTGRP